MLFTGLGVAWHEELAVDFHVIGGVEDNLLRGDELVGGETSGRSRHGRGRTIRTERSSEHLNRMLGIGTQVGTAAAIGQNYRAPLDPLRARQLAGATYRHID